MGRPGSRRRGRRGRGAHRGARDPLCSSLSKLHDAHDSARRAPAQQLTNGTLEICTCTGSTDRDEPPHRQTPHGYGGDDQAQGHAHLSRMQTPARPDGRQGAELDFFKLKKRREERFREADQLFRLSLLEESTILFCFFCINVPVPGKILESTARKPSLSLPTPGTEHPRVAPTPPRGAQRTLNFTGISFKGTKELRSWLRSLG